MARDFCHARGAAVPGILQARSRPAGGLHHPHRSVTLRKLLTALLLLVSAASAVAAEPLRQSFDVQVPVPPVPVSVDGRVRLVYELQLTNFASTALELTRLDVAAAGDAGNAPLASWQNDALAARIAIPGADAKRPTPRLIAPGMHAVVYVEVALAPGAAVPRALHHRIGFDIVKPGAREHAVLQPADVAVDTQRPPVLGPPLRGGPWIAIYGADMPRGHRRVLFAIDGHVRIPARFAIDWMKVDDAGRLTHGDESKVANWYGYGEDVLAVADATVAATRNDFPESPDVKYVKHAIADASGNFVTLDLGGGRYVTYEHLKPGSVRVRAGDRVHRGQVIGALGYTGDSTGPHLHLHASSGNAPLAGEGIPFAIDRFEQLGSYPSIQTLAEGKPWVPTPAGAARMHRGERPAANAVVDFDVAH